MAKIKFGKIKISAKTHGRYLADALHDGAIPSEEGFKRRLKHDLGVHIREIKDTYTERVSNEIINNMYDHFGIIGEFLPQLYILNINKPENFKEKRRDLIISVLEGAE
jgi:hypothetical protein